MTLFEIARRLAAIFLAGPDGRRPVFGGNCKFQEDPHWRNCLLFYEYFHADNGAGLGASHQTGWTGLVATLMHFFASVPPRNCWHAAGMPPSLASRAGGRWTPGR